ncbi:MAG: chemotaxis protein CheA [Planctomycetes bacterium]|nr:chemotaxis protein CheA [Planctomycetota bacterium]
MAKDNTYQSLVDSLAEKAMFAEADDLPLLGEILSLFDDIGACTDSKKENISEDIKRNTESVTSLMLGDCEDPAGVLNSLRSDISLWQKNKCSADSQESSEEDGSSNTVTDAMGSFIEQLRDAHARLEEIALNIENHPDAELIDEALRIIHSLKGESGVLSLNDLNEICHELESILQDGRIENPTPRILIFCDWLAYTYLGSKEKKVLLDAALKGIKEGGAEPAPKEKATEVILTQDLSFYTDFASEAYEHLEAAEHILLDSGEEAISDEDINTIFRSFHTIKGVSGFLDLRDIQVLTHRAENVFDLVRSKELKMNGDLHDLCFKVVDKVKVLVSVMTECAEKGKGVPLDNEVDALAAHLDTYLSKKENVPTKLIEQVEEKQEDSAQESNVDNSTVVSKSIKVNTNTAIKVATDRLDKVINLVGELVTSQAMLNEDLQGHQSKNLLRNLGHMKKNVNELQALAMSLRMVPIKSTFMKMSRIVRDLSRKMNKKIDFTMEGEETEMDRNMVDMLGDPLVHMVRNSADHGVESTEDRVAAGKSPEGHVLLKAFHKGGNIVIQIKDDGKGIDREVILKKAIEKGLANSTQEYTDNEVFQFLFAPGFSTAKEVTDVSGRGVGMDVVRKNIENLRGRIDIESVKGQGTTFSIHLPLTLAIIDGMVISVANNRYIIPTIAIDQTFGVNDQDIFSVQSEGRVIKFREHMVPILSFDQIFSDESYKGEGNILLVLNAGDRHVAVLVDEILAQQEVVIKSLHESMQAIKGLSGSAILPDGTVGLILDPMEIAGLLREGL